MKKYIFLIFLFFHLKTISAQKMDLFSKCLVEVKLSKPILTLSLNKIKSGFTFDLVIINRSSDTILIPKRAKTNNRSAYSDDEIGYTIKKGGTEIKCTYYHDYAVSPKLGQIYPGNNGIIRAMILGDCFKRGDYYLKFYFKSVTSIGDELNSKYEVSSKPLLLHVK